VTTVLFQLLLAKLRPRGFAGPRARKGRIEQAAEKLVQAVILSSSEGSGFEFSSDYRFFVACWLLRMTVLGRFSTACLIAPWQCHFNYFQLARPARGVTFTGD
jgi:hypothetical protein